jgi:hypothetical protein
MYLLFEDDIILAAYLHINAIDTYIRKEAERTKERVKRVNATNSYNMLIKSSDKLGRQIIKRRFRVMKIHVPDENIICNDYLLLTIQIHKGK